MSLLMAAFFKGVGVPYGNKKTKVTYLLMLVETVSKDINFG